MVRKPWYVKKPVVYFCTSKKPIDHPNKTSDAIRRTENSDARQKETHRRRRLRPLPSPPRHLMPLVAFPDNPSSFLWLTAAVPKHAGLPPRGCRSMRPQRFFSSGLARYALCSSGPAPAVCSSFMTTQRPLLSSLKKTELERLFLIQPPSIVLRRAVPPASSEWRNGIARC
jgi:hypothetical protein